MNGDADGMYRDMAEGAYDGVYDVLTANEYQDAYDGAYDGAYDNAYDKAAGGVHGKESQTPGGAAQIKPVYFVYFPDNSPVFSLMPSQYITRGAFSDIQEAMVYFSAHNDATDTAAHNAASEPASYGDAAEPTISDAKQAESKIVLINCLDYYRRLSRSQKEPDAVLLQQLVALKEADALLGIRLLMPEDKNTDQNLLIDLMSQGFHDFWFVPSLNRRLLHSILDTRRSFRDMEAYLGTLPPPDLPQDEEGRGSLAGFLLSSLPAGGALGRWIGKSGEPQAKKAKAQNRADDRLEISAPSRMDGDEHPDMRRPAETDSFAFPDARHDETVDLAMDFSAAAKSAMHGVKGLFHREDKRTGQEEAVLLNAVLTPDAAALHSCGAAATETEAPAREGAMAPYRFAAPPDDAEAPDMHVPLSYSAAAPGSAGSPSLGARVSGIVRRKPGRETLPAANLPASATILFHSEEDCVLPYALASMTASLLASSGGKTLLVELPGSGSRLAETLGLRHPERNLHDALRRYASGEPGPWRRYCFNGRELLGDPQATDRSQRSKRLPAALYFLPDSYTEESLFSHWSGFLASLIHWAIMEEQFSYIVYVGFGDTASRCWSKGLVCGHKVIVLSPWPAGFNAVPQLQSIWRKGCLPAFDGSFGRGYIDREMKTMQRKEYLVLPRAVREDFLQMAALERDIADLSPESLACISAMCASFAQRENRRDDRRDDR